MISKLDWRMERQSFQVLMKSWAPKSLPELPFFDLMLVKIDPTKTEYHAIKFKQPDITLA